MTLRGKILGVFLLMGLWAAAGWIWFDRLHIPAQDLVMPGTRHTSGPLGISSRTAVIIPPKPGVIFSTVRKLEGEEEFVYILLVRYSKPYRGWGVGPLYLLDAFGQWGKSEVGITHYGKRIDVSYRVELDETRKAVMREHLTVGGNYVDPRSGLVFLVDLRGPSPVYRQMKVELPSIPKDFETKEDAKQAANAIQQSLENQDPEIKAFCRRFAARLQTNLKRTFILASCSGYEILNPSDQQIRESLSELNVDRDGIGWVVLAQSDTTYLEANGDKVFKFTMARHTGETKDHHHATREDFEFAEVVQAFTQYRDGKMDWSAYGEWD